MFGENAECTEMLNVHQIDKNEKYGEQEKYEKNDTNKNISDGFIKHVQSLV